MIRLALYLTAWPFRRLGEAWAAADARAASFYAEMRDGKP